MDRLTIYQSITNDMVGREIGIFRLLLLISGLLVAGQAHAAEAITFYHNDILGSPIAVTDINGDLCWREDYKPFGEKTRNEDELQPLNPLCGLDDNQRGYTNHVHDKDIGLTYMQARYYDPAIGRFMGIDPVGPMLSEQASFSRYAYAYNNPYKYTDPTGECPCGGMGVKGNGEPNAFGGGRHGPPGGPYGAATFGLSEQGYTTVMTTFAVIASVIPGPHLAVNLGKFNKVAKTAIKRDTPDVVGGAKNPSGTLDDTSRLARNQPHQREVTFHANMRMKTRDKQVTNKSLEASIKEGKRSLDPETGKTVHDLPASQSPTGRGVTTVTNPKGGVITTIDRGSRFSP